VNSLADGDKAVLGVSDGAQAPSGPGRDSWQPLQRRPRPRSMPSLLAIRAPIPGTGRWVLNLLSLAVPFAGWVALVATGKVSHTFLPSPGEVWSAGLAMARSGDLAADFVATVGRVAYGFGIAVLISVPIGVVMGTFRAGQALFEPMFALLRYLPAAAFAPLLLFWLGIEESPKVALIVLATVFFNTLMTADVVRNVPTTLINVSYTLGAHRAEVLRKVIVPHALPGMIDAIRVNMAAAWNFVVVAELLAATAGLGYRINRAARFQQADKIFAVLIVIGIAGVALDVALRLLRQRVGRWVA
jgi:NitT/TauT family transport system permease protein